MVKFLDAVVAIGAMGGARGPPEATGVAPLEGGLLTHEINGGEPVWGRVKRVVLGAERGAGQDTRVRERGGKEGGEGENDEEEEGKEEVEGGELRQEGGLHGQEPAEGDDDEHQGERHLGVILLAHHDPPIQKELVAPREDLIAICCSNSNSNGGGGGEIVSGGSRATRKAEITDLEASRPSFPSQSLRLRPGLDGHLWPHSLALPQHQESGGQKMTAIPSRGRKTGWSR